MSYGVVMQLRLEVSKAVRVLIADPDESLLEEYREHSPDSFDVVTATNGLECIARLRERVPDVLVLEPRLPWGGGDGVLAMMHDVLDLADVPVMLLTSCSDPLVLDGISRFPISDYHPKPLSPAQLVRRVQSLVEHHRGRSKDAPQNRRLESLIAKETGGRIRRLRVETIEGRIIVHGRSGTSHARQMALAVVVEALKTSQQQPQKVELDIQVCGSA